MPVKSETLSGSASQELVINRIFDAPREMVFSAFAQAESLMQWWGPAGFDISIKELDFRSGGVFHFCMVSAEGHTMWARFSYKEIVAFERIVFVNSFSDEAGNITRAPFPGKWPMEMLNIFTFQEEDGKTRLTLSVSAYNADAEEIKTFENGFPSMQGGYGGTFDQLASYLAKIK